MKLIHTKERELISLCVSVSKSKSQTPLELIHNTSRRTSSISANDTPSASNKIDAFPSLSTSSQDWINSFRNSNPRNSNRGGDVAALIGPPRPPAVLDEEDEDEDSRIGQPRPPPGAAGDDDDGLTIGPPRPPPGSTDSDEDKDEDADEEDEDPGYRVPMSNEIVLKGHTKVKRLADLESKSVVLEKGASFLCLLLSLQSIFTRISSHGTIIVLKDRFSSEHGDWSYGILICLSVIWNLMLDCVFFGFKTRRVLTVDHTGSRVLSGSYDYTVRMYDFQGMNSYLQSFRQLEPFEGHQIRGLSWIPIADRFMCVTGSPRLR
ncbi:hypothetical protein SASPL_135336 [Salvia splendens]|uniref:Uncharacterized protein n=1 Tax=Salvia splendens TaxID=180675 RepID=A0A8X8WZE8_SALSN|nr:hypothetical protein SASPL_135336 [Salvia splendens]